MEVDSATWDPRAISILCVDDEKVARLSLQKALASSGFKNVTVATSGEEALEKLECNRYDLILSDLHMPIVDGRQLIKYIRSSERHEGTTIVLLSATQDLGSVYECLKLGADEYILKPIQKHSLQNIWSNVYRKHREIEVRANLTQMAEARLNSEKELTVLVKEVKRLKTQFEEAVDTPIDVISRTITEIQKDDSGLTKEVRNALGTIVKALNSSDLYRPVLNKLLDAEQADDMTKGWLKDTLSVDIRPPLAPTSWPSSDAPSTSAADELQNWDFNAWLYTEGELLQFLEKILLDFELCKTFKIPLDILRNFLLAVRKNYSVTNPYHNFRHACDVTQATYSLIVKSSANSLLTSAELLGLLLGSICHDLDHPGLNNNFQVVTGSKLAVRYNDKSVLENHHASMAFEILRHPDTNILKNCSPSEYRTIRSVVVNTILATDLGVHMEKMSKFNAIIDVFNREQKEHRMLLCEMILKCADISNAARPLPISCHWSEMIQQEFFQQGDKEKSLDLKVSAFMDRDEPGLPSLTVNFIRYLAVPLFAAVAKVVPEIAFTLSNLTRTQTKWQAILNNESAAPTKGEDEEMKEEDS